MNTLLLQPTDVLFFRDGRPMGGASAGHGAAWPLPTVTDAALHAALHRSELPGHSHRRGRSGIYSNAEDHRDRIFGSLVTAGPFLVSPNGNWFFPRPLDLAEAGLQATLSPTTPDGESSLPTPLCYAIASSAVPAKVSAAKAWISSQAFGRYIRGDHAPLAATEALDDRDFSDSESTLGIGIDPERGTQDGERIYSAHYLRLREGWRLGLFARTSEKVDGSPTKRRDLIKQLFNTPDHIIVGGQQRVCTATTIDLPTLPLPHGMGSGFTAHHGKHLVKWVLLSPSIWPEISSTRKDGTPQNAHPGGWLPSWVSLAWDERARKIRRNAQNGVVLLKCRPGASRRDYSGARPRRVAENEAPLSARLVAALVPKPIVVTGWALPHEAAERVGGGAKSTLLAVPAGAVYYFEAESETDAEKLATALNWHGAVTGDPAKDFTTIKNRRSTLLGEKGFGLGICGTWQFHGEAPGDDLRGSPRT